MAKRVSQLTELTVVAVDDYIPIVDTSAGDTKKVSVKNLTGAPDFGWAASGESWTFNSWTAGTRMAAITIPTDGTTKYTPGMRVRFSQTTGGTKYGIIHFVTATVLYVFMQSGSVLANEAITSPVYSPLNTPQGFPKSIQNWYVETVSSTQQSQASATANVWYNIGGLSVTLGRGSWVPRPRITQQCNPASLSGYVCYYALSTSASSVSDTELQHHSEVYLSGTNISSAAMPAVILEKAIDLAADTTYYFIMRCTSGTSGLYTRGELTPTILRFYSAYI